MSGSSSTTSSAGLRSVELCAAAMAASVPGLVHALIRAFIVDATHECLLQTGFVVALAQSSRRAAIAQTAIIQHRHRRAELVHVGEHMRREEERAALFMQPAHQRLDRYARRGIQAAHGL